MNEKQKTEKEPVLKIRFSISSLGGLFILASLPLIVLLGQISFARQSPEPWQAVAVSFLVAVSLASILSISLAVLYEETGVIWHMPLAAIFLSLARSSLGWRLPDGLGLWHLPVAVVYISLATIAAYSLPRLAVRLWRAFCRYAASKAPREERPVSGE